jgi:membrane-bound lytic murein transglycosylase F
MRFLRIFLFSVLLVSCSIPTPLLEQIKEEGELVVITRYSATTYYEGRDGPAGIEYELVRMFADELGVKVHFIIPKNFDEILPMINRREAHFAAAGLTMTEKRESLVKFTPPYQEITQQLIFRNGSRKPRNIADTAGGIFEVIAGSSHEEELERQRNKFPELEWVSRRGLESEELLYLVREQVIDYTIADSNEAALSRRFYPELLIAFNLTKPEKLGWAFPHAEDSSLYDAASDFMLRMKKDGRLDELIERYYGYTKRLGFVDTNTFKNHVLRRLPLYLSYFKEAAAATGIDWKLLAAMGYQESHWNRDAVSPTGVRGIMMLTVPTAKQLGVSDRTDPQQSIMGGAHYLQMIEQQMPERIENPDRLWLALAAYNVGLGHLEDARILTQRAGGNPDKWVDLKRYLPLLSKPKYYKTVKHGYARGREPVSYVDNIRNYYNILSWLIKQETEEGQEGPSDLSSSSLL